jgi:hypothetical protein
MRVGGKERSVIWIIRVLVVLDKKSSYQLLTHLLDSFPHKRCMRGLQVKRATSFLGHRFSPILITRPTRPPLFRQCGSHNKFTSFRFVNHKDATMDHLTSSLQSLGLSSVPQVKGAPTFPAYNQVDIYRSHIAELLAPITGVSAEQIYPLLQWTQVLEYGDLMLPVPALRIKGKKPDALAQEIKEQVRAQF